MTHYRSASPAAAGYNDPPGRCDGTKSIDGNRSLSTTYFGYPCWRQPGRDGAGNLQPMYVWNNRWSDTRSKIDLNIDRWPSPVRSLRSSAVHRPTVRWAALLSRGAARRFVGGGEEEEGAGGEVLEEQCAVSAEGHRAGRICAFLSVHHGRTPGGEGTYRARANGGGSTLRMSERGSVIDWRSDCPATRHTPSAASDATEVLWTFFREHPRARSALRGIRNEVSFGMLLRPSATPPPPALLRRG